MDVIAYAKQAKQTFDAVPFTEGDGLVLSTLSYMSFFGHLGKTLDQIAALPPKDLLACAKGNGRYIALLQAAATSPRYKDITVLDHEDDYSQDDRYQFSATSFRAKTFLFIGYRGTDEKIIGWLEDIDLLHRKTLISQEKALAFLQKNITDNRLPAYLGGHSKGGNLAVYAAANVSKETREQIECIYNYDSPGFSEAVLESDGYKAILPKVKKYAPRMDVFGMLMPDKTVSLPVRCRHFLFMQHDEFSWELTENGAFSYAKRFLRVAYQTRRSSDKVIRKMTQPQKERFGDICKEAIDYAGFYTFSDLSVKTVLKILLFIAKLKKDDRKIVRLFFGTFIRGYFY